MLLYKKLFDHTTKCSVEKMLKDCNCFYIKFFIVNLPK